MYLCANFMNMTETNNYASNMGNQGAEGAEDTREDMNTDENISGFTHLNEMGANEEELDSLREELQQQKDKYLRLFAEFDNFRKRSARENMELRQTAGKEVIISLLDPEQDDTRGRRVPLKLDVMKNREAERFVRFELTADFANSHFALASSASDDSLLAPLMEDEE